MRILIITLCLMSFYVSNTVAQNTFLIENGSKSLSFLIMDSIYSHIEDGDTIYIPVGSHQINHNGSYWEITNSNLTIIGAGMFSDPSKELLPSKLLGEIQINNAHDIVISGIEISGNFRLGLITEDIVKNVWIKKCMFKGFYLGTSTNNLEDKYIENFVVNNSIIKDNIGGYNGSGVIVMNCYINGYLSNFDYAVFKRNIFTYTSSTIFHSLNSCIFEKNIFNRSFIQSSNINNLTGFDNSVATPPSWFYNSYPAVTFRDEQYPSITTISLGDSTKSLVLAEGQPDIGPSGTSDDFPNSWYPAIPRIISSEVAGETDSLGRLNIKFEVKSN